MSLNRIQKLLFSEYSDFEEMVLIESPFAEVKRDGTGIRQVQVGLTASKLILAMDLFNNKSDYPIAFYPGSMDAEIECMELISIFPVELVSLSVFQRRRKKVLKARFHDGSPKSVPRISFFELGVREKQKMFWNLWCEKVQILSPNNIYGSATEASVASSTSAGSLYVPHKKIKGDTLWCYYDKGSPPSDDMRRILSKCIEDDSRNGAVAVRTLYRNERLDNNPSPWSSNPSSAPDGIFRINRFSEGVEEHCSTSLYLPTECYKKLQNIGGVSPKYQFKSFDEFCAMSVELWQSRQGQAPRLFGITPSPNLNHCSGVLSTDRAGEYTVKVKRSRSMISVVEERQRFLQIAEFQRQQKLLVGSKSCDNIGDRSISHQITPEDAVLFFWTTDEWYKPDKINRMLAHCWSHKSEDMLSKRRRTFFSRKKNKASDLEEKPLSKLRAALKLKQDISAWDLDSDGLAAQLTIMDTALFLKIPAQELRMLKKQGSARNCKNMMTWLIFSHRVSCLIATQIILLPNTKLRARLISRFIMVCEKCHRLSNYQSTSSVLLGLQSPAIYRLYASWSQVRQYHATAYSVFKTLSAEYRYAMLPDLAKPPYLPSARFYLDTLFGKLLPAVPATPKSTPGSVNWQSPKETADGAIPPTSNIMQQIMSVFNIAPCEAGSEATILSLPGNNGDCSLSEIGSSASCSALCEAEGILKASQRAARKYDFSSHRSAKEFLQKVPYQEPIVNFRLSLEIEPPN